MPASSLYHRLLGVTTARRFRRVHPVGRGTVTPRAPPHLRFSPSNLVAARGTDAWATSQALRRHLRELRSGVRW